MDIDTQSEEVRGKGKRERRIVREVVRSERGIVREKSIVDAVLVAAILALAGTLWTFKESVAVLQTITAAHEKRLDTLEGRTFRGVDGYGEADADHARQPK